VTPRLEPLIPAAKIAARVAELAREISRDYAGQEILCVGVLNGCFVFLADLVRQLAVPVRIEFLRVASYGAATESSGVVQIRMDLDASVAGRHVLLVEDILDTGLTLDYLRKHLHAARPASLKICTMLDKRARRRAAIEADYVGFPIEDHFVVGYGLDYDDRYRECPDVCILRLPGHGA
jgi:hypoxanthine phosphoribosyltransferase